jgi:hypothetical protein
MMFLEDGKGVWKRYEDLPWKEYLHLERDKFEELLNLMMESHPDHELTDWLKRGYCMNNGDSTISVGSLSGRKTLNWQFNHFDDEDNEDYQRWYGEEEEVEWDDDDW